MIAWLREFWTAFRTSFVVAKESAERGADVSTAMELGRRAGERERRP